MSGGGAGKGGSGRGNGKNGSSATSNPASSTTSTTLPLEPGAPYAVKQLASLGGETISGTVCSTSAPFFVAAATKKVAWTFRFSRGSVTLRVQHPERR